MVCFKVFLKAPPLIIKKHYPLSSYVIRFKENNVMIQLLHAFGIITDVHRGTRSAAIPLPFLLSYEIPAHKKPGCISTSARSWF